MHLAIEPRSCEDDAHLIWEQVDIEGRGWTASTFGRRSMARLIS